MTTPPTPTDPGSGRPGLRWMRRAACADTPQLAWIGPKRGHTIPPAELERMAGICDTCPVRAACAAFADETGATAGFWAGKWHHTRPHDESGRAAA